jgi:hypothetical protein
MKPGVKHGDGVKARMARFFRTNPEEELTFEQAILKFSANNYTLRQGVQELVKEGLLESVHVVRLKSRGVAK